MLILDSNFSRDDLAFLRTLAEAGRHPQLTCGPYFLAAGLVYAVASFLTWGLSLVGTPLATRAILWTWIASTIAWGPILWWLSRCETHIAGATATINHAISTVWTGMGQAMGVLFLCCAILTWRLETPVPWTVLPSIILAVYGAGWTATGLISRQGWMRLMAIGSLAAAILLAFVSGRPETFFVYGGVLVLLLVVPGWWMVRKGARVS
ncbi:hypothetical protein [Acetobacter orleanensis]|uniref:Uncharacterized protein n=1 Tax=Acetobacter orleanensis TaxID=104099 RepID=A0A4Y3TMW9_9PROT|nr:hypothetical protein [Acetobacter orleanensis]KXV66541.1 hypothetical protein AD949_02290 [Acetobacter orleanensis]PCD79016.1 hypothetical protein CO710_09585 [Acetobacter orleanensis]GAN67746.1 hypothetical protein Abol_011_002 [Acetobacter orleanensis JCM 7639]GBR23958.1 hypothetical protein AA0473_0515 [Acetobacter orleanensis NRIC 0473]GEB83083.1 hypothetical protein AOR01nite_15600 [Acetobacter orleanensis]